MEDTEEHDIYEDYQDESEENQYSGIDVPEYLSEYNLGMAVWLMMFILSHNYITYSLM